jgi:hypothetical protein
MRSVDQAARAFRALAKALEDNKTKTTDKQRTRLTVAVFKAVMQPERMPANGHHAERKIDESVIES